MEKFKSKYRVESTRLRNWDYGTPGFYFITICTRNREHFFGEIENGEMFLNNLGSVANEEWIKNPKIRPDMNLELGEFVVMPNHFHAILIIGENNFNSLRNDATNRSGNRRDAMHGVSTNTTTNDPNTASNKFGPQSKNLSSIIRGYKSSVTTYAWKNNMDFAWQSRFYDHIIRSQDEYIRILNYIRNNPANWKNDKFYKP